MTCLTLLCAVAFGCELTAQGYRVSTKLKTEQEPPEQQQPDEEPEEPEEEESEVLEERRRGYVEEQPEPEPATRRWAELSWDFGPRLELFRGEMVIIVGGRIHADVAAIESNAEIDEDYGEVDPGFEMRRAFLETGGVYKSLDFNFWLNFAEDFDLFTGDELVSSDIDFRNVFVGLNDLAGVAGIRAGYFKEPFGLEEITSSNDITFMERSLTDAFIERRNLGVMIHRRFTGQRRMTASVGGFRDASNELELDDGYGSTARVTAAPWLTEDGRGLLHVGASATYRIPSDEQLRFRSRPESNQAQVLADTGVFLADRDFRAGVEAGVVLGSLSLQSEYIWTNAERPDDLPDARFQAVYGVASYVLTGEHRSYRPRVGAFGAVHPEASFPANGKGAWELALRYSYLDLDSGDIQGGVLHDWSVGLNWYLNDNSRMMFNYINANPEGYDPEHILQARIQINF